MTAYAMGELTIHNKDWMEEYTHKIGPLLKKHGGEVVAKGQPSLLEGKRPLPHVAICIAFPNSDAAKGWYNDPENQALVKLRQSGADFELRLVESGV
ncbi:Uncharacterized conserved protein, DUF1330 family [Alteromonadaceae bacterium Bs31]|nr:Uncharacterized conserved protein, DUF1330 family [Alteromonadaceae bacterium Bs31]